MKLTELFFDNKLNDYHRTFILSELSYTTLIGARDALKNAYKSNDVRLLTAINTEISKRGRTIFSIC